MFISSALISADIAIPSLIRGLVIIDHVVDPLLIISIAKIRREGSVISLSAGPVSRAVQSNELVSRLYTDEILSHDGCSRITGTLNWHQIMMYASTYETKNIIMQITKAWILTRPISRITICAKFESSRVDVVLIQTEARYLSNLEIWRLHNGAVSLVWGPGSVRHMVL